MNGPGAVARRRVAEAKIVHQSVPDILSGISRRLKGNPDANAWTCGTCGCLCRVGEVCPKCRADLVGSSL